MPAVSNTSPLFNLAAIGQLHLLREQFEQILVPEGVLTELLPVRDWPERKAIQQAFDEGWISSRTVEDQEALRVLTLELDQGEAEAIVLALESGVSTLLIDERSGRSVAVRMNLEPTGVLGVLLRAKDDGRLGSVRDAMTQLRENAGFYIHAELFEHVARLAGEK